MKKTIENSIKSLQEFQNKNGGSLTIKEDSSVYFPEKKVVRIEYKGLRTRKTITTAELLFVDGRYMSDWSLGLQERFIVGGNQRN
jgi:hypothetical protein